jgi:hypothetical protein
VRCAISIPISKPNRLPSRLRSPRKLTSEVPGQSRRALPVTFSDGFGPQADVRRWSWRGGINDYL